MQKRPSKQRWSNGPRRTNGAAKQPRPGPVDSSQWQRKVEEYRALAENADRFDAVARENYWQHAEHYIRLINGSAANSN